ncbi:MAG: hypothetical protein AB7E79_09880 [Rhodospirillaceae bacterium]
MDSTTRARAMYAALISATVLSASASTAQVILKTLLPSATLISPESIAALEPKVVMPAGAAALTSYDRYYAPGTLEGRDVIVGVFLKRPSRLREGAQPVPGFLSAYTIAVDKLPRIKGGGCTVVTIYVDVASGQFLKLPVTGKAAQPAVCNGLA